MTKKSPEGLVSTAIFLIGVIILIEAAATVFVLVQAGISGLGIVGWVYVLLKAVVGLFSIIIGYTSRKS